MPWRIVRRRLNASLACGSVVTTIFEILGETD
jgi:hypothetical protein